MSLNTPGALDLTLNNLRGYWGIPSSDGIPYGLADFFFFSPPPPPPSAAEYGIFGGQTQ